MKRFAFLATAASTLVAAPCPAQVPDVRAELVASGFSLPTLVLSPPGEPGDERLFVVEQGGRVRTIAGGEVLPYPFLDLTDRVGVGGERGLLGMAFHPDFASNGLSFLAYTDLNGDTVVERFALSSFNPSVADRGSGTIVITVAQPDHLHNGGCIAFGPDGMLFLGLGDGGNASDMGAGHAPEGNGQSRQTWLGKLLRLDVDLPFPHVPADNPYVGDAGTLDEIFALGLREPWRFSFDRATGDLYIGDVGGGQREEIDYVSHATWAGPGAPELNFGWRCLEGTLCTGLRGCACGAPELIAPLEEFDHSVGCAAIGGHVYRGCAIPELYGTYVYAAFCYTSPSRIFAFSHENGVKGPTVELTAALEPDGAPAIGLVTSFGEDAAGELYLCDRDGEIYRIVPGTLADCNGNGIADGCDVASGRSHDLNGNGVPDECEGLAAPIGGGRPDQRSPRPLRPY